LVCRQSQVTPHCDLHNPPCADWADISEILIGRGLALDWGRVAALAAAHDVSRQMLGGAEAWLSEDVVHGADRALALAHARLSEQRPRAVGVALGASASHAATHRRYYACVCVLSAAPMT
jgi:hypothetical protein